MSWRHPAHNSKSTAAANIQPSAIRFLRWKLRLNFGHLARRQSLQELPGFLSVEQRIVLLNAKKKPVAGGQRKSRHVEDRVVRRGQSVHRQHPEHGGGRGT